MNQEYAFSTKFITPEGILMEYSTMRMLDMNGVTIDMIFNRQTSPNGEVVDNRTMRHYFHTGAIFEESTNLGVDLFGNSTYTVTTLVTNVDGSSEEQSTTTTTQPTTPSTTSTATVATVEVLDETNDKTVDPIDTDINILGKYNETAGEFSFRETKLEKESVEVDIKKIDKVIIVKSINEKLNKDNKGTSSFISRIGKRLRRIFRWRKGN